MKKILFRTIATILCVGLVLSLIGAAKQKEPKPILVVSISQPFGPWLASSAHYVVFDNGDKKRISDYHYHDTGPVFYFNNIEDCQNGSYLHGYQVSDEMLAEFNKIGKCIFDLSAKDHINPKDLCQVGDKYYFSGTETKWFQYRYRIYEYDMEYNAIIELCQFKNSIVGVQPYCENEE